MLLDQANIHQHDRERHQHLDLEVGQEIMLEIAGSQVLEAIQ